MPSFLVRWEVEIDSVDTARDAAEQALEMQRDPESTAVVFDVARMEPLTGVDLALRTGEFEQIDLYEEPA